MQNLSASLKHIMDAFYWLRMCPLNHQEILEVPPDSTTQEVANASICIIQEVVHSSFFPGPVADSIIKVLVPQDHQHLLRRETIVNHGSPRNFHKFPYLPTELRLMIWSFAVMDIISYPRCRVLFNSSDFRYPHRDVHVHERTPPLTQVCSKSREVTLKCGYVGQFQKNSFYN